MTTNNPIPTQQETLERFVLDKSDCVDGGDGCKAEMRHSIAGAFVYHSEIEKARAAVAGPPGDALDTLKLVATTLHEQIHNYRPVGDCLAFPCNKVNAVINAATSSPTPAESLLRDPVKVRVLPTPIVTRDGVPCEDQAAALEEFKERCRAAAVDKGERPLTTSESTIMESDADMARDRPAPPERTRAGGETSARTIWGKSAGTCHHSRLMPECMSCLLGHASRMEHQVREMSAAPADNDAESLLQHVAYSGVEFDDNRMGYVVVQIDRDVWERIKKLAPTPTKGDR